MSAQRVAAIMSLSPTAIVDVIELMQARHLAGIDFGTGHPHGTGKAAKHIGGRDMAEWLRVHHMVMEEVVLEDRMTWAHALQLKFFQVMAEDDPAKLKARLMELAGLTMLWAEDGFDGLSTS